MYPCEMCLKDCDFDLIINLISTPVLPNKSSKQNAFAFMLLCLPY